MIFDDVVRDAVEKTSGAVASVIMASDGITLSHYMDPESTIDLETLSIEYANLLAEISRASEAMDAGHVKEVTLQTDRYVTVLRSLTPEYFMALILSHNGNLGKGRFLLRVNAPALIKEL